METLITAHKSVTEPKSGWRDQAASLARMVVFVFLIHSMILQAFKIPSGSMIPTLLIGDRIFVNKTAYALKIPFSDWFQAVPSTFLRTSPPARGDVIVFRYPVDPSIYYVKRVIGLPGDTVEMKDKMIWINGKPVDRSLISGDENAHLYREHYEENGGIVRIEDQNLRSVHFGPVKVPNDQFFCMGDNRDDSNDSRVWGMVPFDHIEGKAFFIWFSTEWHHLGRLLH